MSALKPTTVRFVPDEATSPDELAIAARSANAGAAVIR